jgi:hypothetical protein
LSRFPAAGKSGAKAGGVSWRFRRTSEPEMMRTIPLVLLLLMTSNSNADPSPPAPATSPPCAAPEYRQFDFWLGEWEVAGKGGQIVGHSRIESILLGCAIAEHWSSGAGGANDGKSYNLYNRELGRWEQFWVDAKGSRLMLSGGLVDGNMVLDARQERADPKTGIQKRERITWTPNADGSVRQLWESSSDEGKTWTVAFDGLYRRVASP